MSDPYLRELRRADLPHINRWRADRALIGQLGSPFRHVGPEVDERWYEQYLASRANNVRLAICMPDDSVVGAVYLLNIDWISRGAEFAIWIGESGSRDRKVGSAATRLALAHAFQDLNLERVYLHVLTDNRRAIALYAKFGFKEEGVQRHAVFKDGGYRDLLLMALLRSGYRESMASGPT